MILQMSDLYTTSMQSGTLVFLDVQQITFWKDPIETASCKILKISSLSLHSTSESIYIEPLMQSSKEKTGIYKKSYPYVLHQHLSRTNVNALEKTYGASAVSGVYR